MPGRDSVCQSKSVHCNGYLGKLPLARGDNSVPDRESVRKSFQLTLTCPSLLPFILHNARVPPWWLSCVISPVITVVMILRIPYHLGCGQNPRQGWSNFDLCPFHSIHLVTLLHYQYSETFLERQLPWETTCLEGPLSLWQKVLPCRVNEPVTKDHPSWETIYLWPMGCSFKEILLYHVTEETGCEWSLRNRYIYSHN